MEGFIETDAAYLMGTYRRFQIQFVRGEGAALWDSDGKRYVDMLSGIGVMNVGYSHPAVVEAVCKQARELMHASNWFHTAPQLELARRIVESAFPGKCFFANSGAEANEGAIKLVRKHQTAKHGPERFEIVTTLGSFHGRTLSTLAATGQPGKQADFQPMPQRFRHVPFNDLEAMREAVDEKTAAVLVEPVQGEGGVWVADAAYIRGLREICDAAGCLLVFDEVQCGLGRVGELYAFNHYGVQPDVLTLAKALGAGLPIGAILARDDVASAFGPGDHGTTFGGNPVVCAAGAVVMDILTAEGFLEEVRRKAGLLAEALDAVCLNAGLAESTRGLGMMMAVELKEELSMPVVKALLGRGYVANSVSPTAVRVLPPLVIGDEDIFGFGDALTAVLQGGEYERYIG